MNINTTIKIDDRDIVEGIVARHGGIILEHLHSHSGAAWFTLFVRDKVRCKVGFNGRTSTEEAEIEAVMDIVPEYGGGTSDISLDHINVNIRHRREEIPQDLSYRIVGTATLKAMADDIKSAINKLSK